MQTHKSEPEKGQGSSDLNAPISTSGFATMGQIQRALDDPSPDTLTPNVIKKLQQTHGNSFILRLLDQAKSNISKESNTETLQRSAKKPELPKVALQSNNQIHSIQRIVHYEDGKTSTGHPPLSLDKKPHTMLIIGGSGTTLTSNSFGSCVGVTFLDTTNNWGAVAHFWAGVGTAKEVRNELAAVVEKIKAEKGIGVWDANTVKVALHVGTSSDHKFSTRRSEELRKILSGYGTVGSETSGSSVSIQVP